VIHTGPRVHIPHGDSNDRTDANLLPGTLAIAGALWHDVDLQQPVVGTNFLCLIVGEVCNGNIWRPTLVSALDGGVLFGSAFYLEPTTVRS